jgi:hypothetical protein
MISLFNSLKLGLKRANHFKNFISLVFLSLSYVCIPEARSHVIHGIFYAVFPEIIKTVNNKLIQKDTSTILSYKSIFLEYCNKIIDLSCYTGVIHSYNNMYYDVPNNLNFLMYVWRAFIEMHRFRYYCEVIFGTILIVTGTLFYPFLKYYYKKSEIIINNLTSIPLTVYRNVYNSIIDGQSIDIRVDNINIISVPPKYKVHMTEDELEKLAPKIMPIVRSIKTRKMKSEEINCVICQDVINVNKEMSRTLPNCKHSFHCHCIDNWFFCGHNICPICRDQIN